MDALQTELSPILMMMTRRMRRRRRRRTTTTTTTTTMMMLMMRVMRVSTCRALIIHVQVIVTTQ